jgi:Tfp pilus assembly protein PilF
VIAGAVFVGAFAAALWRSRRRGDRPVMFALLWIGATLAPSLTVLAKVDTAPLAERYLYLPSAGLCWLFGIALTRGIARRRGRLPLHAVGVAIAAGAAALTLIRIPVWRDNFSLWSDTAARNPVDGLPWRSLAAAAHDRGDRDIAERLFNEALARRNTASGRYIIYNNLGTVAMERNDAAAAEGYYRQAMEIVPTAAVLYNLGLLRLQRGIAQGGAENAARRATLAEARDLFRRALKANPHDAETHVGMAQTAEALGDPETARRHFERALALGLPASAAAAVSRRLEKLAR